jgi:YggT family protein
MPSIYSFFFMPAFTSADFPTVVLDWPLAKVTGPPPDTSFPNLNPKHMRSADWPNASKAGSVPVLLVAAAGVTMKSVILVIDLILNLVVWVLIIQAVMSWLLAFNVINRRNQFVWQIWNFLTAVTEPLLKPIRSVIRPFNGIDLSGLVLIILIFLIRDMMWRYIYPNVI